VLHEGVARHFAERAFHDGTRLLMPMASTGPPFLRTEKLEAASLAERVITAERLGLLVKIK
jgi:hypothetical protein